MQLLKRTFFTAGKGKKLNPHQTLYLEVIVPGQPHQDDGYYTVNKRWIEVKMATYNWWDGILPY